MAQRDQRARRQAARLRSLLLTPHALTTAEEVATWLGAMQAQDLSSALWSLGVRLPGSSEASVSAAFERGEVLRTWPMRGTIHVVPARDAEWMLSLTGPRTLSTSLRARQRLGLDLKSADRAVAALEAALVGGRRLTRAQALASIQGAGVATDGQRGYHLLWHAAHLGVICIGPQQGSDQTFVLLREWAPVQVRLERSEALTELAYRYFRGHGPTTVRDFAGWTGLTLADARAGANANEGRLTATGTGPDADWLTVDLAERLASAEPLPEPTLALPGFDEYLLGYKDRSGHLPDGAMDRVVPGGNGVFRATIVVQGSVVATWRRTLRPGRVAITVEPLAPTGRRTLTGIRRALGSYADFLGRVATITVDAPMVIHAR